MDYTCIPKKGCSLFVISLGVFCRDLGAFINIPENWVLGANSAAVDTDVNAAAVGTDDNAAAVDTDVNAVAVDTDADAAAVHTDVCANAAQLNAFERTRIYLCAWYSPASFSKGICLRDSV